MCGYDPFWAFELQEERRIEAEEHGFDSWADYEQSTADDYADFQCKANIEDSLG